jgi:hypothetical protein
VHYEVRINNTPVNPWRYLRDIDPNAAPTPVTVAATTTTTE